MSVSHKRNFCNILITETFFTKAELDTITMNFLRLFHFKSGNLRLILRSLTLVRYSARLSTLKGVYLYVRQHRDMTRWPCEADDIGTCQSDLVLLLHLLVSAKVSLGKVIY